MFGCLFLMGPMCCRCSIKSLKHLDAVLDVFASVYGLSSNSSLISCLHPRQNTELSLILFRVICVLIRGDWDKCISIPITSPSPSLSTKSRHQSSFVLTHHKKVRKVYRTFEPSLSVEQGSLDHYLLKRSEISFWDDLWQIFALHCLWTQNSREMCCTVFDIPFALRHTDGRTCSCLDLFKTDWYCWYHLEFLVQIPNGLFPWYSSLGMENRGSFLVWSHSLHFTPRSPFSRFFSIQRKRGF